MLTLKGKCKGVSHDISIYAWDLKWRDRKFYRNFFQFYFFFIPNALLEFWLPLCSTCVCYQWILGSALCFTAPCSTNLSIVVTTVLTISLSCDETNSFKLLCVLKAQNRFEKGSELYIRQSLLVIVLSVMYWPVPHNTD